MCGTFVNKGYSMIMIALTSGRIHPCKSEGDANEMNKSGHQTADLEVPLWVGASGKGRYRCVYRTLLWASLSFSFFRLRFSSSWRFSASNASTSSFFAIRALKHTRRQVQHDQQKTGPVPSLFLPLQSGRISLHVIVVTKDVHGNIIGPVLAKNLPDFVSIICRSSTFLGRGR